MFLLAVPFAVREVVDVMVNPELGWEIQSYVGAGECTEELLFEIVSGGANSVDKNLRPVEGRAGIVLIVLSKHNLFMGLVLRQWR